MRLFLSSYRFGDFARELVALAGPGARVAIVANALDFIADEARSHYARTVYSLPDAFADLGLEARPLDLRDYFGRPGDLPAALEGVGLVWVTGGNVFLLRRAMAASGFDELIVRLLAEDTIAYGGDSAGAVVSGPSLRGIEVMDPPHQLADGYPAAVDWRGLGLVDTHIVPHYRSVHADGAAAHAAVEWHRSRANDVTALVDGDVLIRQADTLTLRRGSANG